MRTIAIPMLAPANNAPRGNGPRQFRTLFLSDIHLGRRGCQAVELIDFLRQHEAETI